MELIEVLGASQIGSLLINPKGTVGGELYRHEVEMLADAIPRLKARRRDG